MKKDVAVTLMLKLVSATHATLSQIQLVKYYNFHYLLFCSAHCMHTDYDFPADGAKTKIATPYSERKNENGYCYLIPYG